MVETRAIRRAKEVLHRNRYRIRLEEGIVDSYFYLITYRRREKNAQAIEGPATDAQQERLTRFKVNFNNVQNVNAISHISSNRQLLDSFMNQIHFW